MKKPLQGLLMATEKMHQDTLSGKKRITIREGHRSYEPGPVLIGCHILDWATLGLVDAVRHTHIKDVAKEEYQADGVESTEELIELLRKFYPNINEDSPVTVIRIDGRE